MSVAVLVEVPGLTAAQYDALIDEVWPGGVKPAGALAHIAGPAEGVWRVVDVWNDAADFDNFVKTALAPAMMRAGVTAQPKVEIWPVYKAAYGA